MEQTVKDREVQELHLLQRVVQKINSILNLEILLEEIVGDVAETFGYTRACILLKDFESNEMEIVAVRGWTTKFRQKGDRLKIGEQGIVGQVALNGETRYVPDVKLDPDYIVCEESTRSEVCMPLKIKGELMGIFDVQCHKLDAFGPERIKLLESLANNIEIAIENARLFKEERLEKERIQTTLKDAHAIQSNLFPQKSLDIPGFNVDGICLPCLEVGGDWYDFIPLKNGKLGIVLADVSGKGLGAALLMSSTRSVLRLIANKSDSPKEILEELNPILLNDFPGNNFVTMIYAVLDPKERTMVFSNAGHLDPLFIQQSESRLVSATDGLPLGITHSNFSENKIDFNAGSKIVFYSDGVTEGYNKQKKEEYGIDRLINHFSNPSANIQSVIDEINDFSKDQPQSDDVTLVMVEAA